jgi:hypothetical protein
VTLPRSATTVRTRWSCGLGAANQRLHVSRHANRNVVLPESKCVDPDSRLNVPLRNKEGPVKTMSTPAADETSNTDAAALTKAVQSEYTAETSMSRGGTSTCLQT